MSDLDFQEFSTVQSDQQQGPNTIASAPTIAPSSFLTYVTGTAAVATITPPVSGVVMLVLVFTDVTPTAMTTNGNIVNAIVPTTDVPTVMVYDPIAKKWRGGAMNIT